MKRTFIIAVGLASFMVGCVSSGRYADLKKSYADVQSKLTATSHSLSEERTGSAQLKAMLGREQQERANQETWRDAIEAENEWLFSELLRLAEDQTELQATRDRLKESLAALAARKADTERRAAELGSMLERFKTLIDAGTLSVRLVEGRMVLVLPSDVLFDSGSAKLSKDGKLAVQQLGVVLGGIPERRFQVEGHTDNVPISNAQFASNWELASGRALVVLNALLSAGVQGTQLSAASFGELHPVMSNDSPIGRRENRRIEIVLLPDLSTVPGLDELNRTASTGAKQP